MFNFVHRLFQISMLCYIIMCSKTIELELKSVRKVSQLVAQKNLILVFGQIAVVSFGKLVAWKKFDKEEPIPQWFTNVAIGHVILMCIVTAIKITLQVRTFIFIFLLIRSCTTIVTFSTADFCYKLMNSYLSASVLGI